MMTTPASLWLGATVGICSDDDKGPVRREPGAIPARRSSAAAAAMSALTASSM